MIPLLKSKAYHLLRRSESVFKTDMVYLAKGGFWLTFGQTISTASSFLIAIAFANLLPKESYGVYQYVIATAGILSATTLSGLNTAAVRSVALGKEGVVEKSFRTKVKWGLIGSAAAILIAAYYFIKGNGEFAISFAVISIFLPFFYSFGISSSLMKGKRLFTQDSLFGILSQISAAIALAVTLLLTDNVVTIILVYFSSWTVIRAIVYWISINNFRKNKDTDSEADSYGKHLSLMGLVGTVSDNIDKLLIFQLLGPVQVAIYSFATAPVLQINGLIKNIHHLALPKFSAQTPAVLSSKIGERVGKMLLVSLPIMIGYGFAAPYIYRVFFPEYSNSIIYSQVLSILIIFSAMGTLTATSLEAQMEVRKKYILTFFSKIMKIVTMIALVIPFGLWGMVSALIMNHALTVLVGFFLVKSK